MAMRGSFYQLKYTFFLNKFKLITKKKSKIICKSLLEEFFFDSYPSEILIENYPCSSHVQLILHLRLGGKVSLSSCQAFQDCVPKELVSLKIAVLIV
jgi:hypothetical protein